MVFHMHMMRRDDGPARSLRPYAIARGMKKMVTKRTELLERFATDRSADSLQPLIGMLGAELLPFLRRRIDGRLGRRVDPLNVFQDVCLRLASVRERFEDRGGRAAWAFIYRIARNELAQQARHHGARRRDVRDEESLASQGGEHSGHGGVAREVPALESTPSRAALRNERAAIVHRCLESLSREDRRLIRFLDFEQLGTAETASRLQISRELVRVRHYRALKHLRQAVTSHLSGPG